MIGIGLSRDRAVLLVVDIQERISAAMPQDVLAQVIRNTCVLIESANRLGVPIVVSQQYPKGLGHTVPAIEDALRAATAVPVRRFDKTEFSAANDAVVALAPVDSRMRDQWIVTGMESHVCVYQTARGLVGRGYQAHVVTDAVCSRTKANWKTGLGLIARLGDATVNGGAVLTSTEVVVFDLLGRAGTDDFKALSRLIK